MDKRSKAEEMKAKDESHFSDHNPPLWTPCHCQTAESTSRVLIAVFNTISGLFLYYIIIYVHVWVHATCLWLQIFRRGLKCQLFSVRRFSAIRVTMVHRRNNLALLRVIYDMKCLTFCILFVLTFGRFYGRSDLRKLQMSNFNCNF